MMQQYAKVIETHGADLVERVAWGWAGDLWEAGHALAPEVDGALALDGAYGLLEVAIDDDALGELVGRIDARARRSEAVAA